jgi:hypothetical protein
VVIRSKTHSGDRFILKNVEIITFETKKRLTERSGNKNSILALSNHKSDPITNPDAATAMAMAGNQGHRHTQEAVESGMLISGSNVMDLSLIGIENTPLTAARNQAGESALAGL